MSDLISRKAILEHIEKIRHGVIIDDTCMASIIMNGMDICEKAVRNQPSAQPEPERTIEEFMHGQDMGNPEDGSL